MDQEEQGWDKKRILIVLIILFILGFGIYKSRNFLLGVVKNPTSTTSVKGAATKNENNSGFNAQQQVKENLQEKIDSIKQQANSLNVQDIASSSPQVQKVIQDLKGLGDLPRNQAKDACFNICKGL